MSVEEIKKRVNERGRYSDKTEIKYSLNEYTFVFLNDGFDNFSVETSDIDTQKCSKNEKYGEKAEVENFFAFPCGYDYFN